jgi:hypothetical protein
MKTELAMIKYFLKMKMIASNSQTPGLKGILFGLASAFLVGSPVYARIPGVSSSEYPDFAKDLLVRSLLRNSECNLEAQLYVVDSSEDSIDIYYSDVLSVECGKLLNRRVGSGFSYRWEGVEYQFRQTNAPGILRVRARDFSASQSLSSSFGAWSLKNPDGSWTAAAVDAIGKSSLPFAVPSDIGT